MARSDRWDYAPVPVAKPVKRPTNPAPRGVPMTPAQAARHVALTAQEVTARQERQTLEVEARLAAIERRRRP